MTERLKLFNQETMKMKNLIFLFFILVSVISYGQHAEQKKKETTSELYKRMDKKTRGRLEGNNHKFYPKISSALSYGTNMVQEEIKKYMLQLTKTELKVLQNQQYLH